MVFSWLQPSQESGGPGRKMQNCPHFWTYSWYSRFRSVNSHGDRGGRGRQTRNCRLLESPRARRGEERTGEEARGDETRGERKKGRGEKGKRGEEWMAKGMEERMENGGGRG